MYTLKQMSTGDNTQYMRGKLEERGSHPPAQFTEDGFDKWAESNKPARYGGIEKEPAEKPMEGGRMTVHQAKKHLKRFSKHVVVPELRGSAGIPTVAQMSDFANKAVKFLREADKWLDDVEFDLTYNVAYEGEYSPENPPPANSLEGVALTIVEKIQILSQYRQIMRDVIGFAEAIGLIGRGRRSKQLKGSGWNDIARIAAEVGAKIWSAFSWLRANKDYIILLLERPLFGAVGGHIIKALEFIFGPKQEPPTPDLPDDATQVPDVPATGGSNCSGGMRVGDFDHLGRTITAQDVLEHRRRLQGQRIDRLVREGLIHPETGNKMRRLQPDEFDAMLPSAGLAGYGRGTATGGMRVGDVDHLGRYITAQDVEFSRQREAQRQLGPRRRQQRERVNRLVLMGKISEENGIKMMALSPDEFDAMIQSSDLANYGRGSGKCGCSGGKKPARKHMQISDSDVSIMPIEAESIVGRQVGNASPRAPRTTMPSYFEPGGMKMGALRPHSYGNDSSGFRTTGKGGRMPGGQAALDRRNAYRAEMQQRNNPNVAAQNIVNQAKLVHGSAKSRRAPSARGEIVKRVMREQGLNLPAASKYVKDHGLY
jgi:hypothetical protein